MKKNVVQSSERPMRVLAGFALVLALMVCSVGCAIEESPQRIRKKLDVIVQDDLRQVVAELPDTSIADTTFYRISSYKSGIEGVYSAKAEVEFFFLKGVRVKMVRKYRYHRRLGMWDRYVNEWRFVNDSTLSR